MTTTQKTLRILSAASMIIGVLMFIAGSAQIMPDAEANVPIGPWEVIAIVGFGLIILGALLGTINAIVYRKEYAKMPRRYDWGILLSLALWSFIQAAYHWQDPQTGLSNRSDALLYLGFVILTFIGGIVWERRYRKLSTEEAVTTGSFLGFVGIGGFTPKDERERMLAERASRHALSIALLLLLITSAVSMAAPIPTNRDVYAQVFVGLIALTLGLRSAIGVRMGLR